MKSCTIFWVGTSKAGNHYIGVEYYIGDFAAKKFIKVSGHIEYAVDQVIEVPEAALS